MKKVFLVLVAGLALSSLGLSASSSAENIKVQNAMKKYVKMQTSKNGLMPIVYKGKVLQLKVAKSKKYPDGFHAGVQKKGDLHASCADFVDPKTGNKYDIDFLVNKVQGEYSIVQPIVHSVNGKKNPYDLDH